MTRGLRRRLARQADARCVGRVLRRRLLEQIVDRRLFREMELRPFLQAVVRSNKQIEAALLKEAVRDVEREFYLLN